MPNVPSADDIELDEGHTQDSDVYEMNMDDLSGTKWVKNPKVGETVEFTIDKMVRNRKDTVAIDPNTNRKFSTNLSNVDYKIEIHTTKKEIFTVRAWEIWGKLRSGLRTIGKIQGQTVRIKHLLDGMQPANKEKECYEVNFLVNGTWKKITMTNELVDVR